MIVARVPTINSRELDSDQSAESADRARFVAVTQLRPRDSLILCGSKADSGASEVGAAGRHCGECIVAPEIKMPCDTKVAKPLPAHIATNLS